MILKNRKGQGMTEYIVIIAVAVVALMAFWPQIKGALGTQTNTIKEKINEAGR